MTSTSQYYFYGAHCAPLHFYKTHLHLIHTFVFEEDTVMVSMYDICVEKEDGSKDIYKE